MDFPIVGRALVGRQNYWLKWFVASLSLLIITSLGLADQAQAAAIASTTTVSSSQDPSIVNQAVIFTIVVNGAAGTATGTVSVDFGDGASAGAALSGGTASVTHTYTSVQTFTVTATYAGDVTYAPSNGSVGQQVAQASSSTTVSAAPDPSSVGQIVTFTASVTETGGLPASSGTVTFNFGDGATSTASLSGGVAQATHAYTSTGNFTVTANYSGTPDVAASSGTVSEAVNAAASTTTLTSSSASSVAGQSVTFTATVSGVGGITPTGSVTFDFGDGTAVTVALAGGVASTPHTYAAAGNFTVTASYGGGTSYLARSTTISQNVANPSSSSTALTSTPDPSSVGQSVTFTATVTGSGGTPSGTVSFSFGDGVTATSSLVAGVAAITHAYAAPGGFTVTVTYSGDVNFTTSSATRQQTVSVNATTISLSSSPNPSQAGQAVIFTANVTSPGGAPTGNVTFKDGGTALGTVALSGGAATFTTTSLATGNHTITASYLGASGFAASTSAALIQVVNTPSDSLKLRTLQVLAAPVAAQNSGQAISGAVDSAIAEGFSTTGGTLINPSATGIRFNFAADPDASPSQIASSSADSVRNGSAPLGEGGQNSAAQAYAGNHTGRVDSAFDALASAMPTKAPPRYVAPRDWLVWAEIHGATLDRWGTGSGVGTVSGVPLLYGNQINVLAGVTRRMLPNLLVGALGGYETFDYRSDALQGRLKGDGWTIGPYLGWMIAQDIRFDAAFTYSGIGYDGLAGTASGSFPGHRWLLSAGLTGTYRTSGFLIEPSARVYALWEREDAYSDSLGTLQAPRDFSTGRASAGMKVTYPIAWSATAEWAPYVGLYGDYYFNTDNAGAAVAPAVPTQFVMDGWSARATAGVATRFANGAQVAIGSERGGIGGNFAVWTYRVRASVPFDAQ
ncbi:Ig-like domain repeat protein [Bradyrhizobium sp. ARR65]|uniref:autotransporter outer membrane beta-barrel domain-containing protein n=1 Tax=Bradyrhizobium sp. ARR65 TaxID=1040989 RepID=UPI000463710C|nr:Ig-like domain repeat protein [Bradyrhizobium sp. ARR65]